MDNHTEFCGIHDGDCYVCGEKTNSLGANPSEWSIFLAHIDGQTKHRYYHIKCLYPILKAPKNELVPLNISEFRNYCTEIGQPMSDYAASKICSKFGSSGKRPLDVEKFFGICRAESTHIKGETFYRVGIEDFQRIYNRICKEFSTAEVSLSSLEQTIINNGFNGGITTGDGPILVQPKQLAKAIKRELDGK